MKKFIVALSVVAFLAISMSYVAFAVAPKEAFTINYLKKDKTEVHFPHKKHSDGGIECMTCHHMSASNDAEHQPCSACHKATEATKVGDKEAPAALHNEKGTKNIFHDRCIACHKEKEKGPTKCKECHAE